MSFPDTERLDNAQAKLEDYRAWTASGAEKLRLKEAVFAWARDVGPGLDELTPEQRKEFLQMVVEEVVIDGNAVYRTRWLSEMAKGYPY